MSIFHSLACWFLYYDVFDDPLPLLTPFSMDAILGFLDPLGLGGRLFEVIRYIEYIVILNRE